MKKTEEWTLDWKANLYALISDKPFGVPQKAIAIKFIEDLLSHALAERDQEIRKRAKRLEHNLIEADLAHSTPLIRGGRTVIKGTRLTVQEIAEFLLSHKEET